MDTINLSSLTERISGPASKAWDVGDLASRRMAQGEDIIHLGIGDPELDTPEHIRAAMYRAVEGGKTHYSPLAGELELRETVAEHARTLYGGTVDADNVVICNGAQGAIFAAFQCIAEAGDEIIALEPYYSPYPAVVTAGGATMVSVPLDREQDYHLDMKKIAAATTDKTKAILVNSPSNPAGTVYDVPSMIEIAKFCYENDIWLVSDEVYWSMCFEGEHISPYSCIEYRDKMVVINSLSKSHAMTGWRLGWAIGPTDFIKAMTNFTQAAQFGINQFVQTAAIAAIKDRDTCEQFNAYFKSRRDALCEGLRKSNHLSFATPKGGMFVLVDISETGLSGKEFAEQLLDAEQVAVVPGFGFGDSVANTVRVGYLCSEEKLTDAAARIVRFTEKFV